MRISTPDKLRIGGSSRYKRRLRPRASSLVKKDNFVTVLLDLLMLSFSVLIAHWLVQNLSSDELALKANPSLASRYRVLDMRVAEPLIAAEIIRSRRYKYSVTVLAIGLPEGLPKPASLILRMATSREKLPRRIRNGIASTLASQARQSDLIIEEKIEGHFLLICPELAKGEHAQTVVRRIKTTIDAQLGMPLKFGVSTFPEDELTIEAVIEKAKGQLKEKTGAEKILDY